MSNVEDRTWLAAARVGGDLTLTRSVASNQAHSEFGRGPVACDVNGDGFHDIVVDAKSYFLPGYDGPMCCAGEGDGAVFVFAGGPDGPPSAPMNTLRSPQKEGEARFGHPVACAGDVDGDGYDDVIVADSSFSSPELNEGRVWLFHGSASGLTQDDVDEVGESNLGGGVYGESLGGAGDVNGDGYDDVIVGAPYSPLWSFGGPWPGRTAPTDPDRAGTVYVYLGSPDGLLPDPIWAAAAETTQPHFGEVVARAGDVNGDGYDDVAIGMPDFDTEQAQIGEVIVFHGGPEGPAHHASWKKLGLLKPDSSTGSLFGEDVSTAGDVNGDGYDDLLVTDGLNSGEHAYLFLGAPSGLGKSPAWVADELGDHLRLAGVGDVNADGFDDVVIGLESDRTAFLFLGSDEGLPHEPDHTIDHPDTVDADTFWVVSPGGDVNADGHADLLVGLPDVDVVVDGVTLEDAGGVAVFVGGSVQGPP